MAAKYTKREVVDGKIRCGSFRHEGDRMRPLAEFCKSKTPDGLSYSCKKCRTSENSKFCNDRYRRWKEKNRVKSMLLGAKGNASKKGIPFTITEADIAIPTICPILGIPLFFSEKRQDNTPSIDRIDNSKGYIPNNVIVVSWRANFLKKDATIQELQQLSTFYNNIQIEEDIKNDTTLGN